MNKEKLTRAGLEPATSGLTDSYYYVSISYVPFSGDIKINNNKCTH